MKLYWEPLWAEDPRTGDMADGRSLTLCIGPFVLSLGFARRERKRD